MPVRPEIKANNLCSTRAIHISSVRRLIVKHSVLRYSHRDYNSAAGAPVSIASPVLQYRERLSARPTDLLPHQASRSLASVTNMPSHTSQPRVNVVGAGVLGLSAALTLQERHPNLLITIIASEFPSLPASWTPTPSTSTSSSASSTSSTAEDSIVTPSADYASMWAGAHYRPIPRSSRQLDEEYHIALQTAKKMRKVAMDEKEADAGVKIMPAVELLETVPKEVEAAVGLLENGSVYAGENDGFRVLNRAELSQYRGGENDGIKWGCSYESWCVNVHMYCVWLLNKFVGNGGEVVHRKLSALEDAFTVSADASVSSSAEETATPLVVNCSGRNFDTDPKTQIIRGQTVLVRNKYHRTITRQNSDGSWAFLIPRPGGGGTVVGGTKEIGDLKKGARSESRQKLLEAAVKYFPDFVDSIDKFDVVMDNVGRRPWREGGLRIEAEDLGPSGHSRWVVHGYGAGGRGYELSWGVAERIADLVNERL